MSDHGMTTMAVRQINKSKIYASIYQNRTTSKHAIVNALSLSLSTVTHNLLALEQEGLIFRNGYFASTGGRKSQVIQINPVARIAIGICIYKSFLQITAIDLYGTVLFETSFPLPYFHHDSYYQQVGQTIDTFISSHFSDTTSILGVSIAVQGIITTDGKNVSYGAIMNNEQMQKKDFEKYISYPCHLEHDSKAAGFLEQWDHPELDNAMIFLLNRNLGGALILNHDLHLGTRMRGGIIEHLCLDPEGPACYCGKKGCLETYCSANALEKSAGTDIPTFFSYVRKKDDYYCRIWQDYLTHLAFSIQNLNIIVDGAVIISGYLSPYFLEEDLDFLYQKVADSTSFSLSREQFFLEARGEYAPAIGAALFYISQFLTTIPF